MTIQIHGVPGDNRWDHAALVRYPSRSVHRHDDIARRRTGAAHAIIAIRETCNKLAPTTE